MLETLKNNLGISHNYKDDVIYELIEACKMDLQLVGIAPNSIDESDYLIRRAINLYVSAYLGQDVLNYDKLVASYEMLRNHLSSSVDYTEV